MPTRPENNGFRQAYTWALKLYPATFRNRFESEMMQIFDDLQQEYLLSPSESHSPNYLLMIIDTTGGAIKQQYLTLKQKMINQESSMNKTPKPRSSKQTAVRFAIISAVIATALLVVGVIGNSYIKAVYFDVSNGIQTYLALKQYSGSSNVGWDEVTANFVNDYMDAKYHNSGRTDVGYKSVHAGQTKIIKGTTIYGLERNTTEKYSAMQPNFDPIICSTQAPTSVKYLRQAVVAPGSASMIAAFGYDGKAASNLVEYALELDLSKSKSGDWKIMSINCLSLDAQTTKPYTPTYDASGRGLDTPLDRNF